MALIHSIATSPINNPQSPENGQLGTDGLDFLTALLGLQADQALEEGQSELFQGLLDQSVDTLNFGPDAALPIPAENTQNAQILASLNLSLPQGAQTSSLSDATAAKSQLTADALSLDALKAAEASAKSELQALFNTPVEDLQPAQLKQLISAVWGKSEEVKDVQVEEVDPKPALHTAESAQHSLLKSMAAEKNEVVAGNVKQERPEIFSVRSDVTNSQPAVLGKEVGLTKEEKKAQADSMPSFSLPSDSRLEIVDSAVKLDAKPDMSISHAKLMPQVLPKIENLVEQGGGKMTLQLDPPEMGKLTIEVTTRGKNVELAIHADNDMTRSTLEGGLADLRASLATQDLQLTHAEVQRTSESSFGSLQFGQSGSESGQQDSSKEGGQSFFGREEKNWSRTLLNNESPVARNRSAGRLDFRV